MNSVSGSGQAKCHLPQHSTSFANGKEASNENAQTRRQDEDRQYQQNPSKGTVLGGFRDRVGTCTAFEKARATKAKQRAVDLAPTIRCLQAEGRTSLGSIAAGLNVRPITAARGVNGRRRRSVQYFAGYSAIADCAGICMNPS
jgi:hypothetical protein